VVRRRDGAATRYTLVEVTQVSYQQTEVYDQRRAGVTVVVCGGGAGPRRLWQGSYAPEALQADAQDATATPVPHTLDLLPIGAHVMAAPGGGRTLFVSLTITNTLDQPLQLDAQSLTLWDGQTGQALPFTAAPPSIGPHTRATQTLEARAPSTPMALLTTGPTFGQRKWHITVKEEKQR
jgi:hypothetical protein